MTRFAASFLLVFGELAFGGMLAISIPPFSKVERGFYRSSAAVYLAAALASTVGLAMLARRAGSLAEPTAFRLWVTAAIWAAFSVAVAVYLFTLWSDNARLRARAFSTGLLIGLGGVMVNALALKPASLGAIPSIAYCVTAIFSSLALGLVSAGMLFGHWYLIDPNLPVDYLRTLVRLLAGALVGDLLVLLAVVALAAAFGGAGAEFSARSLFDSELLLFGARLIFGPVASLVLVWMTWQTLKIPQTMAATGLLYIAVMSVLVGELLGRFIMFRTAIPL